jgi:hypothetical protein
MKFSSLLTSTAILSLGLSMTSGDQCDMQLVKQSLATNATTGLDTCNDALGFDLFTLLDFPPVNLTKALNKNRGCVNSLNMVNNQAQKYLTCNLTFGPGVNDTTTLGAFLKNILRGRTGNLTEDALHSWSDSESESESGSGSEEEEEEEASSNETGEEANNSASSTMMTVATTASMIALIMALA